MNYKETRQPKYMYHTNVILFLFSKFDWNISASEIQYF